jgi:hypothetical protein
MRACAVAIISVCARSPAVDDQVADDDTQRRAHERVEAAPVAARLYTSSGRPQRRRSLIIEGLRLIASPRLDHAVPRTPA